MVLLMDQYRDQNILQFLLERMMLREMLKRLGLKKLNLEVVVLFPQIYKRREQLLYLPMHQQAKVQNLIVMQILEMIKKHGLNYQSVLVDGNIEQMVGCGHIINRIKDFLMYIQQVHGKNLNLAVKILYNFSKIIWII